MLWSLAFVLTYGAYLAYSLLSGELRNSGGGGSEGNQGSKHWSTGLTWSQYASKWSWALSRDFRIGGVGLIALLTAPLAWTMFGYHIYLIWAGTTTNESSKWLEWREHVDEGLVYKWVGDDNDVPNHLRDPSIEPFVDWPVHSHQRLFRSEDGRPPPEGPNDSGWMARLGSGAYQWKLVSGLYEVENLYDLGFWDNLKDAFWPG
ncbi:MAG: hypothetical protein Q9181_000881 [Wetmoreana brouardii]